MSTKASTSFMYVLVLAATGCGSDFGTDDGSDAALTEGQDVAVAAMKLSSSQCTTSTTELGPFGHVIMPAASNGSTNCWLDRGSYGEAVGALQAALNACWYQDLEEDQDYGRLTQQAVRAMQSSLNINADGVYGPETKRHMGFGFATALFGGCGDYR
jgi:murein L,D-transpeptidase YcbB/YkuD